MDGADSPWRGWSFAFFCPGGQQRRQHIDQRRRQETAGTGAELGRLMRVTHRCQARGFIHDDDVLVQVNDVYFFLHGMARRVRSVFGSLSGPARESAGRIPERPSAAVFQEFREP